MKRARNRVITLLLAVVLAVGLLPAAALAKTDIHEATGTSTVLSPVAGDAVGYVYIKAPSGAAYTFNRYSSSWWRWNEASGEYDHVAEGDTFYPGVYRATTRLEIGFEYRKDYDLEEPLSVTVNGETWTQSGAIKHDETFGSSVYFRSPDITVTAAAGAPLAIRAPENVPYSYLGVELEPISLAEYTWGGTEPYVFTKISGPDWLTVSSDGTIGGTSYVRGANSDLVFRVTDAVGATVLSDPIPVWDSCPLPEDRTTITTVYLHAKDFSEPVWGAELDDPAFTADGNDCPLRIRNERWQLQGNDGSWQNQYLYSSGLTFVTGKYRCAVQLVLSSIQYRFLSGNYGDARDTSVLVDGEYWTVDDVRINNDYCVLDVHSPEFTVEPVAFSRPGKTGNGYAFDGNLYPGDTYHFTIKALGETNTVCDLSFDTSNATGVRGSQDGSSYQLILENDAQGSFRITATSRANPQKTGTLDIEITPKPTVTEILAPLDLDSLRLSAEMTGQEANDVIRRNIDPDFVLDQINGNYAYGGKQARVDVRYTTLYEKSGNSWIAVGDDAAIDPGKTYAVGVWAAPLYPYRLNASVPPTMRRVQLRENGTYVVCGTAEQTVVSGGSRACTAYFEIPADRVTDVLYVEQAELSYDAASARYSETMTGSEATAELRARLGDPAADAQAAPIVGECYVAKKNGDYYEDVSSSAAVLGQGEFYAVFILQPANGNHWNFAEMTRESNPRWPLITAGDAVSIDDHWILEDDDACGRVAYAKRLNVVPASPAPRSVSLSQNQYGLELQFSFSSPGPIEEGNPVPTLYRVERKEDNGGITGEWTFVASYAYEPDAAGQNHRYTYADTDLTAGRTYTYRVRSENENGCSAWLTSASKTPAWNAPAAVNSSSVAVTQNVFSLELRWGAAEGAQTYTIYRASSEETPGSLWPKTANIDFDNPVAVNLTETSFTDTDVELGKWYGYCIAAVNPGGETRLSSTGLTKTKIQLAPPVLTGLTAAADRGVVTVTWDEMPGARYYTAQCAAGSSPSEEDYAASWMCYVYLRTGEIAPDGTYTFRVRPVFEDGSLGGWAYTELTLPPLPTGDFSCWADNTSYDFFPGEYDGEPGVYLDIQSTEDCDGYSIYRSKDGSAYTLLTYTTDGPNTVFVDHDVLPGHNYSYHLHAYNAGGVGEYVLTTRSVCCAPGRPASITAQALPGRIHLSWTPVENAEGYRLYIRYFGTSGWSWLISRTMTDTSYDVTDYLVPGEAYTFAVLAVCGEFQSGPTPSNTVTALSADAVLLEITSQPRNYVGPVGSTAAFSVTAAGGVGELSYQWQYRTSPEGAWTDVSAASGKTANYSLTVKAKHDGYQYRCVVTDGTSTAESEIATLTVGTAITITEQPADFVGPVGSTATFTVDAEGAGELSYQWKYRTSAEGAWTNVSASSGKTPSYSLTVKAKHDGYQYMCVVTDGASTAESDVATLTVGTPVTITRQPADYTGPVGSTASFTVAAAGAGELSYQWKYRTSPEGEWVNVGASSGMTPSYSLTVKARHDGYQYMCVVTDGENTAESDIVTLLVGNLLTITLQPADYTGPVGSTAAFKVAAAGGGELSYQWKYRTSPEGEWVDVSAASGKTAAYSMTVKARHDGYQYKCVVTDGANTAESEIATLTVGAALTIARQPADYTGPAGSTATFAVAATGAGELSYQWKYRTTPAGEWVNVSASSGKTVSYSLTVKAKHNGYQYMCVVTDGENVAESDIVTLLVDASLRITEQPEAFTGPVGSTASFTVAAAGGSGALSYQWKYRTSADGEWVNVSAESGKTPSYSLTVKARHNGYQYCCVITDGTTTIESGVVTLTVR